jgi:hypothetical protein
MSADTASLVSPEEEEEEEEQEVVAISTWLRKPDVIEAFKCHEVKVNGYMYAR